LPSFTAVVASAAGFGHAEAGPDRAARQRAQPAFLVLGRADRLQQVHVALVGGGDVHRQPAQQRVAGFLEHHRLAEMAQPQPAVLGRDMRRHQPLGGSQLVQLQPKFVGRPVPSLPCVALQRNDLFADEAAGARLQFLDLGRDGKIHECLS
jgi:hypothetical protein